jgi:hypothetical protein
MRQFVRARASFGQACTVKLYWGQQTFPDDVKTATRTIHQMGEAVCVGRWNVFRVQKGHHIEVVVGVRSLVVDAVVTHPAALYTVKVTRVAPLPEGRIHG